MKRRNFVKEKDTGQTPPTSRVDMPEMLRDAVLVRVNNRAVEKLVAGWDNLEARVHKEE
jgi:hypothetical protein